jgi:hypothetical protein
MHETHIAQYAERCFLASFGDDRKSNLASLDIKHGVSWVSLREDGLLLGQGNGLSALAHGGERLLGVEIVLVGFDLRHQESSLNRELHSPIF